jgi:hypothetical protein
MQEYEIIKCACKGVPTNFAHDFIIGGMAKVMKPLRLKEALIRIHADANKENEDLQSELGENVWYEVEKKMKSVYIKRKGEGITRPVNIKDIEELEDTAVQKTYSSIVKELSNHDISIKKPDYFNPFENTVIPAGYFNGKSEAQVTPSILLSTKVFHFRTSQCVDLHKNTVWFKGDILQVGKTKTGRKFYRIFVENYKGQKPPLNFWGAIYVSFFKTYGLEENLLNKKVEIILADNYIDTSSLKFNIKISEAENMSLETSENIDDDNELTEKEIKTLMAQDWSKIECLKKKIQK